MNTPKLTFAVVSNVWCKQMHFVNVDDTMIGHKHTHDHMTLLAKGSVEVDIEGKKQKFVAPHIIYIHKDKKHHIKALENDTIAYCIHALRDADEDIIEESMIPEAVKNDAIKRILKT